MPAESFRVAVHSDDYFPNIGGVASHVYELTSAVVEQGISAGVVTAKPAGDARFVLKFHMEPGPPPVLRLPRRLPIFTRYFGATYRAAVKKFLAAGGPSDMPVVSHCHWHQPWWMTGCQASVFTNHTSMFLQDVGRGRIECWEQQLSVFDAVIAPSSELAQATIDLGVPAERVTYIPNGVDSQRFKPNAAARKSVRNKLGIAEDAIVLLCARRIVAKNGVIDFAHSLRFVEQLVPPAYLSRLIVMIAGNRAETRDSYQDETLDALSQTRLGRRAILLGRIPNDEIPEFFAAADLSVLPSLKEATSIAGLEAMATGVPLVGTRVGGIPDLITDKEDGLLVEHGNPPALAAALARMVNDSEMRRTMSERARHKALIEFDWKTVAKRTVDVYQRALEAAIEKRNREEK
ncbi:MAG: glycosyltransferase family 4 protein [Pirellulales bacterium]|nr:glycosyltransferase family 4 protein [Pirellulales bacterium]